MSKRTIRIKLEVKNPNKFLKLCKNIVDYHLQQGVNSPFTGTMPVNMADYANLLNRATQKREEALEYYAKAEAAMQESRMLIGTDLGQTLNTGPSLYSLTNLIKRYLLVIYDSTPDTLSLWGFNVVIGTAKFIGRRKKEKQPVT